MLAYTVYKVPSHKLITLTAAYGAYCIMCGICIQLSLFYSFFCLFNLQLVHHKAFTKSTPQPNIPPNADMSLRLWLLFPRCLYLCFEWNT